MPLSLHCTFATLVALLVAGAPSWYQLQQTRHYRNFHEVVPGTLYRSGQLDLAGLEDVVARHGIRTIVCLRDADSELSRQEEEWARGRGLGYVRLPPRPWHAAGGAVPAEEGLAKFRAVMAIADRQPVLVHCFAGMHRTGAYCAIYRMDHGWRRREALAEMRLMGYQTLGEDEDILRYLDNYPARP